ncbi:MAG: phosphotransferase [Pseudomonadota bacterium]
MTTAIEAFLRTNGWPIVQRAAFASDASTRRYERVRDRTRSAVLMIAPPAEHLAFERFLGIAAWLRRQNLSAPEIYATDVAKGLMLMEDFGDTLMARMAAKHPMQEAMLYTAVGQVVIDLETRPPPGWVPVLDADGLCDLMALAADEACAPLSWSPIRDAVRPVLRDHLNAPGPLSLRDLHAENVVWLPDRVGLCRVGLLDFQDAVVAPPGYDLASLVDDPRRVVPENLRAQLIADHAAATGADLVQFTAQVNLLSLARNVRILGIFRRLARAGGRTRYLQFIPRAVALIRRALRHDAAAPLRAPIAQILRHYEPARLRQ